MEVDGQGAWMSDGVFHFHDYFREYIVHYMTSQDIFWVL